MNAWFFCWFFAFNLSSITAAPGVPVFSPCTVDRFLSLTIFWRSDFTVFKSEILFFYVSKNRDTSSSVYFTKTSEFLGTASLCVFNILNFSAKFWCCVRKHDFLFIHFANTLLITNQLVSSEQTLKKNTKY